MSRPDLVNRQELSKLATASVVLGFLGPVTFGVTSAVGLLAGIAALVQIRGSRGVLRGTRAALFGLAASASVMGLWGKVYLSVHHSHSRAKGRTLACQSTLKWLAQGMQMYVLDYGRYPLAENWGDALQPYVSYETPRCPQAKRRQLESYAFNASLSGAKPDGIVRPDRTVMLFDATPGRNLVGGEELLAPRHRGEANIAFVDGHIKGISDRSILEWGLGPTSE